MANIPNDLVPIKLKCMRPYSAVYRTATVERATTIEVTVYVPKSQVHLLKNGANDVVDRRTDHTRVYHNTVVTEIDE